MKIPETKAGCEAMLPLVEKELKALTNLRYALVSRIAERPSSSSSKAARAASAKGGAVKDADAGEA